MVFGPLWRVIFFVFVVLTTIGSGSARAEDRRRAGTVRLESASGARAPIALRPEGGNAYAAELSIVNDGKEPLVVSRIAVHGDASDPRVPAKVVARLAEGSLPVTVPPGASRKAVVRWTPERGVQQRQLFGHVVVTTSDDQTGEVAMGVHAQIPGLLGPLESRVLSILLAAPLLGAMATFLARLFRGRDDRTARVLAVLALLVQTLLAGYVYVNFARNVSRADGNDGLQFIEHSVSLRGLAAEIYLGVDGIGALAMVVTSAVALFAVLRERTVARDAAGYHAALLVLDAALMGALAAMDGLVFLLFALVAVVSAALLVGAWGGAERRHASIRLAGSGLLALVLLAVAITIVSRHADTTFLADGTKVERTFSLPELSRVALGAKGATSTVKTCFVLVILASLILLAAFPFHRWLGDVLVHAPPATGILVASALPTIGLCAFLRIGCAVLPDGMRWASGVVVALGAVSAAYGALSALGQTNLRRLAACATTTQAGFILLGAGSLTPQGLSGAMVLGGTRALACGVFLLLASAIDQRSRTTDAARLGGVAAQMPAWSIALVVAGLGQAGVLGLGGGWGPILALLGVLSSYAPLAIVATIALVVLAAAHLITISRIAFGPLNPEWEKSELLEPYGGKFPDLTKSEWPSIGPLVFLVILVGLWPAPVIGVTTGTVRDLANAVSPPGPDQVALR